MAIFEHFAGRKRTQSGVFWLQCRDKLFSPRFHLGSPVAALATAKRYWKKSFSNGCAVELMDKQSFAF
jgi:hypothetical protein